MKIGILSERLLKGFGVDLVIHNQANGLADNGHEVTVYVQRYDKTFKKQKYKVVEIDSPLLFNPIKTEYKLFRRKIKFFRNQDNSVWIVHSWPFFVLVPFLKGKVFVVDHGTVSSQGMYLKRRLVFWYQKYMSKYIYFLFANKVFAISEYIKNNLPVHVRLKTKILYNGADQYTKNYKPNSSKLESFRNKLGIEKDKIYALYVGRLNHGEQPYKGVNDLIEIYEKVREQNPKIRLIMAGFGSEQDGVELREHGIIVEVAPPEDELLMLFDICDIYVSATKWEGFNLPMIEAQSFGKVPVVYNIGPHEEILRNNIDSFIVDNQEEFIARIVDLSDNQEMRERMGREAQLNSKRYTWEKSIEQLNNYVDKYG
jgi:glycosyltransferase involved in cell wall biosynthesis